MLDHKNRVADIVDCLRSAAAGADVAWSISNALDRMRYGLHGSLTPDDRDNILRAIVTAHGTALANLPVFSPVQLALGFGAMADKVMSNCQRHGELPLGASLDLHDRLRIFQSELDIVAREQDISARAKASEAPACTGDSPQHAPRRRPPTLENYNQPKLAVCGGIFDDATE